MTKRKTDYGLVLKIGALLFLGGGAFTALQTQVLGMGQTQNRFEQQVAKEVASIKTRNEEQEKTLNAYKSEQAVANNKISNIQEDVKDVRLEIEAFTEKQDSFFQFLRQEKKRGFFR